MKQLILAILSGLFLSPTLAFAQVTTGTPAFASWGGGPDALNLANLNVHIEIPIINKAGRGTPFVYNLTYDSAIWYPVGASGHQNWQPISGWGWTSNPRPLNGFVSYVLAQPGFCSVDDQNYVSYYGWSYTDQLGVNHPLNVPGVSTDQYCGSNSVSGSATDGSGFAISIYAPYTSTPQIFFITVTSNTGTQLLNPPVNTVSGSGSLADRNGNKITVSNGVFTDTLGTTALTVAGLGTPSSPITLTYTAPAGSAKYTVNYTSYTVATNFGVSGISEFGATVVSLVSSISLPDGTEYTFNYEPTPSTPSGGACTPKSGTFSSYCVTARIASMQLPAGGKIQYTYSGGNNGVLGDGTTAVLTRQTPDGTWTYTHSLGTSPASTDIVTDPTGNDTVIQFQKIYETQRQVYSGSHTSGTLLQTTNTCYNGSASPCTGTSVSLPITQKSSIIQDASTGLECQHVGKWSSFGVPTEQDDYDYGHGSPGSLIKKVSITYASLGNNINAFRKTVTVQNGGGVTAAQATFSYDETAVSASSGTPQHVSVSGSRGNLTSIFYATHGTSTLKQSFTYYDTGTIKTATDVNNATATYNYPDATSTCGNAFPTSVSEPLTLSKSMTWNCMGGVETSLIDENGQTVSTTYNDASFWRPTAITDQENNATNLKYAAPTSIESTLNFNGSSSTTDILSTLDTLGRPHINQKKQSPSATSYDSLETDYDSLGRPCRTTVPYLSPAGQTDGTPTCTENSGPAVIQTYDPLNRKLVTTDGGGGTVTLTYMGNDVLESIGAPVGENSKRKQLEYNSIGQLTSVCEITAGTQAAPAGTCGQTTAATGYWTKYTYDALGELLTVTQNAQSSSTQSRTYTYDLLGRMTSEENPETGATAIAYVYDSDATCGASSGDKVKKTDAAGNVTCYTYDGLHRFLTITYPSGPNSSNTPGKYFIYDGATINGTWTMANAKTRLAEAYTATCQTCTKITDEGFSYTARGEVSDEYEGTPHSAGYYHASATYWPNGVLNALTGSGGYSTNYNVDGEGRLYSAGSGGNQLASTIYNAASEPTIVTFASLDSDSFSYDSNTFRMKQYKYTVGATPKTVVGNLTWNANGTLGSLGITDAFNAANTQTCTYSYDDLARIASGNCGSSVWSQTFSYDAFGNITKTGSEQFQPGYNLNNQMLTGASYDAMGDVVSDGLHSYAWNSDTRPTTIDTVTVTYDAFGRMVEQGKSGTNTEIEYSPTRFKMQLMNGQSFVKAFVPMPGGTEEVWQTTGTSPYYRHSDWLGSSRFASTYSTRSMYNDLAYAPFGETYAASGSTGVTDISFAGNNEDTTTNLYDAQFREYGIQGRWASPDPTGVGSANPANPQSWNRYAYVLNNPLSSIDPQGKDCQMPDGTIEDGSTTTGSWISGCNAAGGQWIDGTPCLDGVDVGSPVPACFESTPSNGGVDGGMTSEDIAQALGQAGQMASPQNIFTIYLASVGTGAALPACTANFQRCTAAIVAGTIFFNETVGNFFGSESPQPNVHIPSGEPTDNQGTERAPVSGPPVP